VVLKIPSVAAPDDPDTIFQDPFVRNKLPHADPNLGGHLDILLGSLEIIECSRGSTDYSRESAIAATPIIFGWTFAAPMDAKQSHPILKVQSKEDALNDTLLLLWELDQTPDEPQLSEGD